MKARAEHTQLSPITTRTTRLFHDLDVDVLSHHKVMMKLLQGGPA